MRFTSLADWLGWLEKSHPKEIDLGLDRIRRVAQRLELLNPSAKIVTVAGTNGKGSCVTATAGLIGAAGFQVGSYTSPHLLHYAERIQINGKPVSDDLICDAFEKIADAANEISLTYFEYGTLAALLIFKEQSVDFIVLEVGLGGRLDAVNIIDADIAVITSIAIDHQDWLGDNREVIGREKAGILRLHQIFVCADDNPTQTILDAAQSLNTNAFFIGKDFDFNLDGNSWSWAGKNIEGQGVKYSNMIAPHLPLPSLAASLQVVQLLGISLTEKQIESALLNLSLAGRFQKLEWQGRECILDVAHNPAATVYLAKRLASEPSRKTYAIVAMMADKDRLASLENLLPFVDEWNLLALDDIPRAASVEMLADNLAALAAEPARSGTLSMLMASILSASQPSDRILVFGSFFTVAAALAFFQAENDSSRGLQ